MMQHLPEVDWIIMAAAVADVKPAQYSAEKLPKSALPETLPLAPVPDIVATLAQFKKSDQRLIGFAAQTGDIVTPAKEKLQRKQLDAIAANPIDQPNSGFGSDQNQAIFIDATGRQQAIAPCSKLAMAHQLLDFIQSI
jgi:phosphopantothenoylcysteine decarboxylase/phosphopantothenate--cysteine ligase